MTKTDFLLYPLGTHEDRPICEACEADMALAKFQGLPDGTEFSTFQCHTCNRSETFIAEKNEALSTFRV